MGGRFRSEILETDAAVIACATYIDLNPVRAGIAATPEQSDFTSIQDRIRHLQSGSEGSPSRLVSVSEFSGSKLTELQYLMIVDETGRAIKEGKASLSSALLPILQRLALKPDGLIQLNRNKRQLFRRVIAPATELKTVAKRMGKQWVHGLVGATAVFL